MHIVTLASDTQKNQRETNGLPLALRSLPSKSILPEIPPAT